MIASRRRGLGACALLALAVACGETPDEPRPDPPWPDGFEPLPACEPVDLVEPPLAAATGQVVIEPSTALVATDVLETLDISVVDGAQAVDPTASGDLTLTITGGELVSSTPVVAGRATAVIRLDDEGVSQIDADLAGDGRAGSIELFGYQSKLPLWEIAIDQANLDALFADPRARLYVPAVVAIDGTSHPIEIRIHGGSSRDYPKLSFRINLDDGVTASGQRHLILRAEFNDKSLLRNWAAFDLIRSGSWIAASRSELVHLRINDRYYGVMHQVEKIDSDFLRVRGLSPGGELFEADPPRSYGPPGGNLTPLPTADYPIVYQQHNGNGSYDGLIELIEGFLQLDAQTFARVVDEAIVVDDYLVYLAMMAVIQSHDHVRKNYYLYRETGFDDPRWRAIPWDLELTFGHLSTEDGGVLDEELFVDGDLFVGEQAPERFGFYNQLTDLILADPQLRSRFLEFVEHIADHHFDPVILGERIDTAVCLAGFDILADRQKRATNDEFLDRVAEVTDFVTQRRAFIRAELARLGD